MYIIIIECACPPSYPPPTISSNYAYINITAAIRSHNKYIAGTHTLHSHLYIYINSRHETHRGVHNNII